MQKIFQMPYTSKSNIWLEAFTAKNFKQFEKCTCMYFVTVSMYWLEKTLFGLPDSWEKSVEEHEGFSKTEKAKMLPSYSP